MHVSATATAAASTATTASETVPLTWSAQDDTFFRITRELFSPSYLRGATVLLMSYDPEPDPA
jgi:hypothetical protein